MIFAKREHLQAWRTRRLAGPSVPGGIDIATTSRERPSLEVSPSSLRSALSPPCTRRDHSDSTAKVGAAFFFFVFSSFFWICSRIGASVLSSL